MNALRTLFLLAAGLSVACCGPVLSRHERALNQFWIQIRCEMPDSRPIIDYADYGCYCGKGGGGTPVDDLDRCCEVHDNCYGDAMQLNACWSLFHNPYTKMYSYSCDKASKKLTCNKNNNACEMFICECDRKAAECFARTPYNPEHKRLPSDRCQ
ncbi:phospholipase A2-like isoform X1 [Hippoglossus hippoglossus]|uniref:phospholipase A2-like isoform X1 n=1 Tax=Hippoglossus hippoglossus TaxID=8267 RepID=UPI00148E7C1F|nr:phospholipase A2-like isoform X1 [Hippoglossus hippoglossus]